MSHIADCHGGQLSDSRFGTRMTGEGPYALMLKKQFKLAKGRYFKNRSLRPFNLELYHKYKKPQLELFSEESGDIPDPGPDAS